MTTYRTIEVHTLSKDFRAATRIVEVAALPSAQAGELVVQNHYVGINATDINVTNGTYGYQSIPFGCGLEGLGVVVAVGDGVINFKVGEYVAYQKIGAFSEYVVIPAVTAIKSPTLSPSIIPLTVCGISASIALETAGKMTTGETVLVTAAAGGTGQFVVQLAKLAGNHVIGTCSSEDKVQYLKSIGCDRVINYNKESVDEVLKAEYPKGVNLVFESVGGEMMKAAVANMAKLGRIIVFGSISNYLGDDGVKPLDMGTLTTSMIMKSITMSGFLLFNEAPRIPEHIAKLLSLVEQGKLQSGVDPSEFVGLEAIPDAIAHMYARKNIGKIVVKIAK